MSQSPEKARSALMSRIAGSLIQDTNLSYDDAEDAAEVVLGALQEDYEDGKLPGFPRLFEDQDCVRKATSPFGEDPFEDEDIFDVELAEDELPEESGDGASKEPELDVFSEETSELEEDFFAVA